MDGTWVAHVPEIRGLLAFGADVHECAKELYALLEEGVRTSLESGNEIPVLDGIDLNSQASHLLASYHRGVDVQQTTGDFFEDERELAAAFAEHAKLA